jgi:hypothetical protein
MTLQLNSVTIHASAFQGRFIPVHKALRDYDHEMLRIDTMKKIHLRDCTCTMLMIQTTGIQRPWISSFNRWRLAPHRQRPTLADGLMLCITPFNATNSGVASQ